MREIKFRAWDKKEMKYDFGYIRASNGHAVDWSEDEWEDWKVMQYTGLKDRNGKDIYEGDILRLIGGNGWREGYTKVIFDNESAHFTTEVGDLNEITEFEVTSNIYENPELLKDKL